MEVQIFDKMDIHLQPIMKTLQAVEDDQQEWLRLCTELGLQRQLSTLRNPYPLLTEEEYGVWRKFLPTTYIFSGTIPTVLSFRGELTYRYDTIPLPVLREWQKAKELEIFDVFRIHTPEISNPQDPILLGAIGNDRYLIARWGESLQPFARIQEIVQKRTLRDRIRRFSWR